MADEPQNEGRQNPAGDKFVEGIAKDGSGSPSPEKKADGGSPDLDVILDIPVQISMEVAVRQSLFVTCCSSIKVLSSNSIDWQASRSM